MWFLDSFYKIFIAIQNYGIFKRNSQRKRSLQLTVPEMKIFFIFCYLLVLMSLSWISATLETSNFYHQVVFLAEFVQCMSGGVRRGLYCERFRRKFETGSYPELILTYLLLYSFMNFSNLPFVIKYQTTKHPRPQQK